MNSSALNASLTSGLTEEKRKQLCDLLGNVKLSLLYKASVHGYQASAFHQRCDSQGPTLLVAYNRTGYIFGAYTSVDYTQSGQYITDESTFLFSFQGKIPVCIKVNSGHYARVDDAEMPNFGQQLYFCYNNQPVVYNSGNNGFSLNPATMYGNDTRLTECEVYKVEQSSAVSTEQKPWRNVLWTAERKDKLMEMIRNYKPLVTSVSRVRILMIMVCKVAHISESGTFNPTSVFQPEEQKASRPASLKEKIHCVVYVIDATKISLMSDKLQEKIASVRRKVNSLGIAQIVLMTKVDEACPQVEENLQSLYLSSYITVKVQEVSSRWVRCLVCYGEELQSELELELNCDVLLSTPL
ncbi:hypothetical protein cypCar_00038541 [Cyprinus carpio]|nr:hypothetical protein cypCar_00038541 [Cyprinus carpio]